jgi:hypothetical protein
MKFITHKNMSEDNQTQENAYPTPIYTVDSNVVIPETRQTTPGSAIPPPVIPKTDSGD